MASIRDLGKYFAAVSWASGLVVVLVPVALLAGGAPSRRPDLAAIRTAAGDLDLEGLGFVIAGVALLGVMLQPLQYGFTQLLEGYWGSSTPATRAMGRSSDVHMRQVLRARTERAYRAAELRESTDALEQFRSYKQSRLQLSQQGSETAGSQLRLENLLALREQRIYRAALRDRLGMQEIDRFLAKYPEDPTEVMPTKLGNMLRRYERIAGRSFGHDLSASVLMAQVADANLRDYYDDARTDLDVSVRMSLAWLISAVVTTSLTWRYDVWLLIPLSCYLMAWISYKGSIGAAASFGDALIALMMLGRFDLYRALDLPLPKDSDDERLLAEVIERQFNGWPVGVTYSGGQTSGDGSGSEDRDRGVGYL